MAATFHQVPIPLTTALRARPTSTAYRAIGAAFRPTALHSQRAYICSNSLKRVTRFSGVRINRVNPSKPGGVRSKSSWNHSRGKWVGFGWGIRRAWHRPGCKWVGAEGDPKSTPRDKECPACQDEENLPFELSPRELHWQRQLEEMKKFLVKDPYEALFGYSNRMLSGRSFYMPPHFPWSEVAVRRPERRSHTVTQEATGDFIADPTKKNKLKGTSTSKKAEKADAESNTSSPNPKDGLSTIESLGEMTASSANKGYAKWRVSGFDEGQPFSASGEFTFDPITMKMMPRVNEKEQIPPKSREPTSLTKVEKIHVTKFAPPEQNIARFEAKPSALHQPIENRKTVSESASRQSAESVPQNSYNTAFRTKETPQHVSLAASILDTTMPTSKITETKFQPPIRSPQSWKALKAQLLALKQNLVKLEVLSRRIEHQEQGFHRDANRDARSTAALSPHSAATLRMKQHLNKLSQHILTMMGNLDAMSKPTLDSANPVDEQSMKMLRLSVSTLKRGLFRLDQEVFKGLQRLESASESIAATTSPTRTLIEHVNTVKATQGQLMQNFLEATVGPQLAAKPQRAQQEKPTVVNSEVLSIRKELIEAKQGLQKASQDLLKAKHDLERSWAKEYEARMARLQESKDNLAISADAPPKGQYAVMQSRRSLASRRFTREELVKYARQSILKKDKPLKHMSINELQMHRAALTRAWAAKTEPRSQSPAERKLQEEIKAQKTAYAAFEDKWSNRRKVFVSQPSITASTSSMAEPEDTYPQGEGDLGRDAAKFATSDRWYKKKAPHALAVESKAAKDRLLVREIRKIYEDTYGEITTSHQQRHPTASTRKDVPKRPSAEVFETIKATTSPSFESYESRIAALQSSLSRHYQSKTGKGRESPSTATKAPIPSEPALDRHNVNTQIKRNPEVAATQLKDPALYRVLAYDKRDQAVHVASASSTFHPPTDTVLSASEALLRLRHPAKFLPYLTEQQDDGYEIVSANKNLLVFKRVQPASETSQSSKPPSNPVKEGQVNPVDLTGRQSTYPKTQTGNFASPTGFVNHDPISITPPATQTKTSQSSRRVNKEEPVFSGTNKKWNWEEYKAIPTTISEDSVRTHAYVNKLREQTSNASGKPTKVPESSTPVSSTQADAIRAREAAHRQDILRTIVDSSSSSDNDGNKGNSNGRTLPGTTDSKASNKSRNRYWREYVLGIPPHQRSVTKTILYSLPRAAFDLITLLVAIYVIGVFIENRREKRKQDETLDAALSKPEDGKDHGQKYWGRGVERAIEKERSQSTRATRRKRDPTNTPLVNTPPKDPRAMHEERLITKDNIAFAGFCFMAGTVWWMAVRAFWNS